VYGIAQPALVKAMKFTLCGKYLEPEKSYARMVELYEIDLQLDKEFAAQEKSLARKQYWREHADRALVDSVGTLVALLVLNGRKVEAEKIAERVKNKSKYPNRDSVIDAALEGKLPKLRFE
jgi:hypothetical protein